MTLKEKITKYIKEAPHSTMLGHTLLSRPRHAQLPDYPYGYTVRAFKVEGTAFTYSQIMWDFLPVDKDLVGLKEEDFPWDDEELAWVQDSEMLDMGSSEGVKKIGEILKVVC